MEGTWVQKTAWGIVMYMLDAAMKEGSNYAWDWFSQLFAAPVSIVDDPLVQTLTQVAVGLVLGFLPVAITWMVIKETAARLDGSSTTPPEALIRRTIITGIAVTGTSLAAWFMLTLAELARGIMGAVGVDLNPLKPFFEPAPDWTLVVLVLALLFLVGGIVLVIQRAIVTAELTVLLVIGPLMAAGLIREGGATTWNVWLRELTSLLVTGLIQMLVVLIFVRRFAGGNMAPTVFARLSALAFLWVLWNTPRWARHLVYSVGAGNSVVGSMVGLTRMAVMRQMLKTAAVAAAP